MCYDLNTGDADWASFCCELVPFQMETLLLGLHWTSALHRLQRKKKENIYNISSIRFLWGWVSLSAGGGRSSRRLSPELFSSSLRGIQRIPGSNWIFNHSSMLDLPSGLLSFGLEDIFWSYCLAGLEWLLLIQRCSSSDSLPTHVWALRISTSPVTQRRKLIPAARIQNLTLSVTSQSPWPRVTAGTGSTRKCKSVVPSGSATLPLLLMLQRSDGSSHAPFCLHS